MRRILQIQAQDRNKKFASRISNESHLNPPPIFSKKQLNLRLLSFTLIRSHYIRTISDDEREGHHKDYPKDHVCFAWIKNLNKMTRLT